MSLLTHMLSVGPTIHFFVVSLLFLQSYDRHNSIDTNHEYLTDVYDYIVIGSGSAGSIVAHRLAEDGKTRVLLLEAGGPAGVDNDIPGPAATFAHFNSIASWNYTMDPQPVGRAFLHHQIPDDMGFIIGGTSSINTMIYNRGNPRDYDAWEKDYGAVGWSYADVLPFFKKWEANRDPHIVAASPGIHGTTGPIGITSWAKPDPITLIHQDMMNHEAGLPTTDINGLNQAGTAIAQAFIDSNGVRSSASNSYIDPNPFPHNLHILSGAFVTKILIEHDRAVGVLFERKYQQFRVMVNKEVIVSCGPQGSPKLLLLSGIGPKEHLQEMHIPVVKDLPVGNNFQNHPELIAWFPIRPESRKLISPPSFMTMDQLYLWFTQGKGPLSSFHRSVTYLSTPANKDKEWPNFAIEMAVYQFPQNLSDFRQFRYQDQYAWDKYHSQFRGQFYLFANTVLHRVRSRGYVRLASPDPHVLPRHSPNFLQDPQDYRDEIDALRTTFRIYELSSFSKHLLPHIPIPGCKMCPDTKYVFECTPYLQCLVEQIMCGGYHSVGSNRMGDPKRHDTVLDPSLRVKGISGLRVCDNSVAPLIPNSNTNALALMIGEKCAHTIRTENNHY